MSQLTSIAPGVLRGSALFDSSSKSVEIENQTRGSDGLTPPVSQSSLNWLIAQARSAGDWIRSMPDGWRKEIPSPQTYYDQLHACHTSELMTTHTSNGETLFVSLASQTVAGVPDMELVGSGLLNRLHLQDRIVFLQLISEVAGHGGERSAQLRFRNSAGADAPWRTLSMDFRRISDPKLPHERVIVISTDVTDQRENEIAHERALTEASVLDEDSRRFLATMSHELRTPLNAIIGFADILDQEIFGKLPHEKNREHVSLIKQSGEHLLSVVNDLLDVSRLKAGKYELSHSEFDMETVVADSVNMLSQSANASELSLTYRISEKLPKIYADRRSCQQILINIISNAIKFTPVGGSVSIDVKAGADTIDMTVTDTGIGISDEFLPLIGQAFVQAEMNPNRRYEGSGLGLSVVKGLVDLHGGKFEVRSELSKGTAITISLPLKPKLAKPIPSNDHECLVQLSAAKSVQTVEEAYHRQSEGEYRARVSA